MRGFSILKPLFVALPVLVWIYFAASFWFHPGSPIWHYHFVDSDDYLYLTQAIDWLQGQSWFDQIQHRLDPPRGVPIHFSHLLSALYAAPIFLLTPSVGLLKAATITAALFPLLYLAGFLMAIRWAAAPWLDKNWRGVTSYIALFCMSLMFQFIPGRVDHHGLEALLAVIAFGFAVRMMLAPLDPKPALWAGAILGLALGVALEISPVLALIAGWIGLWALIEGRPAARAAFIFGAGLFIVSLIFLLLTKSPAHLADLQIDSYSAIYVALTAAVWIGTGVIYAAGPLPLHFRIICGIAYLALTSLVFFYSFPQLPGGLYGEGSAHSIDIIFHHAGESWPLLEGGPFTRSVCLPLLGLVALGVYWRKRPIWPQGLLFLLIAASFLLAFVQQRMMVFAEAFAIIPLALALQEIWAVTASMKDRLLAVTIRIFVFLLAGPLTTVMFYGFAPNNTPALESFMFPVQQTREPCDQNRLIEILNSAYGDGPRLIMSTIGQSTELLFRTPHSLVAGPFHEDVDSNLLSYAFFTTRDPASAESIARDLGVDLVAVCKNLEPFYVAGNPHSVDTAQTEAAPFFVQDLTEGKIPSWLDPVEPAQTGDMLLFQIKPRS